MRTEVLSSSFRDPSGFLFFNNGDLYRQINQSYQEEYDLLRTSGLYDKLTRDHLLVGHDEADISLARTPEAYKIIKPKLIPFISYPYEWSFSQLQDAAMATLTIQQDALEFGMTLKDASAYNIQFEDSRPIFIDTLSFEKYNEGKPWVAYRQFCQHFLAPLTLMSYTSVHLNQLMRVYIDGIPLDLAVSLLPLRTRLSFSLLTHLHWHARSQAKHADKQSEPRRMGRLAYIGLIDNLQSAVRKLSWSAEGTEWADYYDNTNYTKSAHEAKKEAVGNFLDDLRPTEVWDLGANTGVFSRLAADRGIHTVAFDIDPAAVEKNYLTARETGEKDILPLLLDLSNPSPGIGWKNEERASLIERGPTDVVLALALIHHLAIANNLPFSKIADFFHHVCESLVIEFVPKSDSQVKKLLSTRPDIFTDYDRETFESVFSDYFSIDRALPLADSDRTLYLMTKK